MSATIATRGSAEEPEAAAETGSVRDPGASSGAWAAQRGLIGLLAVLAVIGLWAGVSWLVIIGVLVATLFLHELGHFVVARLTGMKVTEFFIGFGPRVWSFRRGETEYGIKAIWAGAYVRIIGMNNLDEVDPADETRSFRHKSYPRKLAVLVAGSGVHFVLAVGFLGAALFLDGPIGRTRADNAASVQDWTLATVSVDSAASSAGLRPGDELLSVGGVELGTFAEFSRLVQQSAGRDVEVVYLRDGERVVTSTVIGERLTAQGAAGIMGLIGGDRILAIEGLDSEGAPTYAQVADWSQSRAGQPLDITIVDARTGAPAVVEGAVIFETVDPTQGSQGFFGVSADYHHQGLGPVAAAGESIQLFGGIVRDVVLALPSLVTEGLIGTLDGLGGGDAAVTGEADDAVVARELEARRLDSSHPDENRILSIYGVARIGASVASDGVTEVLILLAFVNVFIGVFNLLPLLPLDGGHVAVVTYERLRSFGGRRHQVNAANLLPVTYAVVLLLLVIGGMALVRDILDPINIG